MAIQQINLGSMPLGAGGDTQRAANEKINQNFSNQTHAASRLVGVANGQIPLAEQTFKSSTSFEADASVYNNGGDCDSFEVGTRFSVNNKVANRPPNNGVGGGFGETYIVETRRTSDTHKFQLAYSYASEETKVYARSFYINWKPWVLLSKSSATYSTTTAIAPNVVVETDGTLKRSSSSAKYKEVITKLELDNDLYIKAMQVKPIVYRSKADGDPKDWHYMSFLAEEIGEIDPSLTQWLIKTHDDEGNELDEPTKEAEGINLNAICAVLHATNIYQDKKLKELEQRLTALESNNEPIE